MSASDEHSNDSSRRSIGQRGESLAVDHLREAGYAIRERNYEIRRGEVDVVAETSERLGDREIAMIVFVEVKTRSQPGGVSPESAVTREKRETITSVADWYLEECDLDRVSSRFDVVTVQLGTEPPEIDHYPSAFDARGRLN